MFICGCWLVAVNGSHGQMIDEGEGAQPRGSVCPYVTIAPESGKFQWSMRIGFTWMEALKTDTWKCQRRVPSVTP
jgi:hypothetical protein